MTEQTWHTVTQAVAAVERSLRVKAEGKAAHLATTLARTSAALEASDTKAQHLLLCFYNAKTKSGSMRPDLIE